MATTQANSIPSPLNPGASEYVPLSVHEKEEANITPPQIVELELPPPIDSVPRDILETVLALLDDPRDVASAARSCRRFAEAAGTAPLGLGLSPPRQRRLAAAPLAGRAEAAATTGDAVPAPLPLLSVAARVRSLGRCWPGITSLSLGPGPPAADNAAVSLALTGKRKEAKGDDGGGKEGGAGARSGGGGLLLLLPRLAELRLDRCTKLTSAAFAEEEEEEEEGEEEGEKEQGEGHEEREGGGANVSPPPPPPLARLGLLGADRCFSLSADALTLALRASAAPAPAPSAAAAGAAPASTARRRRLASLALSHLDLSEWPPSAAAAAPEGEGSRRAGGGGGGGGEGGGEGSSSNAEEERGGGSEGEQPWSEAALSAAVDDDGSGGATPEEGAALAWGDAGALDERRRRRRGNSGSKLPSPLSLGGLRGGRLRAPLLLPSATTNLRCLALTNCSALTVRGLEALCEAAPLLRVLALGGSSLAVSPSSSSSSAAAAAAAPPPPPLALLPFEDGSNSSASPSHSSSSSSHLRAAHIGAAMAALASRRGAVANVGSPGTLWPNSSGSSPPQQQPFHSSSSAAGALRGAPLEALRAAIVAEIGEGGGGGGGERGGGDGSSSGGGGDSGGGSSAGSPSPPLSTACFGGSSFGGGSGSSEGALLSCCLRRLRHLRCVELTFWPRGTDSTVARSLGAAAAAASAEGGRRKTPPVVWNLARGADAAAAASAAASPSSAAALLLRDFDDERAGRDDGGGEELLGDREEARALLAGLRLALAAAANCSSSPGRQSPLHLAASSPDPAAARTISALASLGARPDARDRSGATPAFVAAEAGREGSLRALLTRGNADGRARNSAGEAPLYIASLRGHSGAVSALLDSFRGEREREREGRKGTKEGGGEEEGEKSASKSCWTCSHLYGDGWTPLMAAALGGRREVLRALLAAAAEAEADGGSASAAALLVRAANRYGQTALHIAARRGCLESLAALLEAAKDGDVAALRDSSGDSAADVAARAGHFKAAALLSSAASASSSSSSPSYDAENVKVISPKWRPSENVLLGRRRRAAW